jgi:MerR family copper efflux transcriptional regulator
MREALTISGVAKRSGVPPKTLRYWESLGLLPKAARTHTGYRSFDSETLRYIAFIRKSKSIGLTLAEMREILRLARTGHCPCPEVVTWTQQKAKSIEAEIRALSALLQRLKRIRRGWANDACKRNACGEVCYLIAELPESKSFEGGKRNAKTLDCSDCCHGNDCCDRVAGVRRSRKLLPGVLPLLPGQLGRGCSSKIHN